MYNQRLIIPQFDIYEFAENYKDRNIDIDTEGYEIILEALDYFKNLEIPPDLFANVTEIYQDGGNDIYMQICPFWNGEDDRFNIKDTDDVFLLTNLKKMTIFYGEDKTVLDKLKVKNINVEYL